MKRIKTTVLALSTLALLGACASRDTVHASKVDESTFHRRVKLVYDASNKMLDVYMDVRVGGDSGTSVILTENNIPKFEGEKMQVCESQHAKCDSHLYELDSGTYYYTRIKTENPKANYTVTWFNANGSQDDIHVPMAAALEPSANTPEAWEGPANQERESVRLSGGRFLSFGESVHEVSIPQTPGVPFDLKALLAKNKDRDTIEYCFNRTRSGNLSVRGEAIEGTYTSVYYSRKETILVDEANMAQR